MTNETTLSPLEQFWNYAGSGQLWMQCCGSCGELRFLPADHCPLCGDLGGQWKVLSGQGELMTWTVVHRTNHPIFSKLLPYVVGRIELREQAGLKVQAFLRVADPSKLHVGMPMRFQQTVDDGLPRFVFENDPQFTSGELAAERQ